MLLRIGRVFFALCVVAFAVLFGRSAMGFGGGLMVFRRFVVFVFGHWMSPVAVRWTIDKGA